VRSVQLVHVEEELGDGHARPLVAVHERVVRHEGVEDRRHFRLDVRVQVFAPERHLRPRDGRYMYETPQLKT